MRSFLCEQMIIVLQYVVVLAIQLIWIPSTPNLCHSIKCKEFCIPNTINILLWLY